MGCVLNAVCSWFLSNGMPTTRLACCQQFVFFFVFGRRADRRVLLTLSTHSPQSEGEEQRVGPALMGNTGILHSVAIYSMRRVCWQTGPVGPIWSVCACVSACASH
jgi:hypothetical protein